VKDEDSNALVLGDAQAHNAELLRTALAAIDEATAAGRFN
jgi:hypothetical protein